MVNSKNIIREILTVNYLKINAFGCLKNGSLFQQKNPHFSERVFLPLYHIKIRYLTHSPRVTAGGSYRNWILYCRSPTETFIYSIEAVPRYNRWPAPAL